VAGVWNTAWPLSTSVTTKVPDALGVPALPLFRPPASVTVPVAVPAMAALSFVPLTVTSMICEAVPSVLAMVSVSCAIWPAVRAWVAALLLFSE